MLGPNEIKASTEDHESVSVSGQTQASADELRAAATETETPEFADDAPGEGYGMLESIPGVVSFHLKADAPDDCGGPVARPLLHASPWTWISRLAVIYEDWSEAVYTGWLASARVVVTSGRCLFDSTRGVAREVTVEAALDGSSARRRWVKSSEFRMVKGWVRDANPECDYSAVLLPEPGLPDIGHFGLAWLPSSRPKGEWLNLAGYPPYRSEATQWYEALQVEDASERFLHRAGGFHEAAAGSPLWLYMVRKGRAQRYVCGLVGSNADSGDALRLHRDIYSNLLDWIKEATAAGATAQPAGGAAKAGGGSGGQATAPSS
jgi:glutamyl endopeptidase